MDLIFQKREYTMRGGGVLFVPVTLLIRDVE